MESIDTNTLHIAAVEFNRQNQNKGSFLLAGTPIRGWGGWVQRALEASNRFCAYLDPVFSLLVLQRTRSRVFSFQCSQIETHKKSVSGIQVTKFSPHSIYKKFPRYRKFSSTSQVSLDIASFERNHAMSGNSKLQRPLLLTPERSFLLQCLSNNVHTLKREYVFFHSPCNKKDASGRAGIGLKLVFSFAFCGTCRPSLSLNTHRRAATRHPCPRPSLGLCQ